MQNKFFWCIAIKIIVLGTQASRTEITEAKRLKKDNPEKVCLSLGCYNKNTIKWVG